jgi:hypothetical protein
MLAASAWQEGDGLLLGELHLYSKGNLRGICSRREGGQVVRVINTKQVKGFGDIRDQALPVQQHRTTWNGRSGCQCLKHGCTVRGVQVDPIEH